MIIYMIECLIEKFFVLLAEPNQSTAMIAEREREIERAVLKQTRCPADLSQGLNH